MSKTYYLIDLSFGGFESRGRYETLLVANARLKTFRTQGFVNAFIVQVTEEKLKDAFVIKTLQQVERVKSRSMVTQICDECLESGQLCYTHTKLLLSEKKSPAEQSELDELFPEFDQQATYTKDDLPLFSPIDHYEAKHKCHE